MSRITFQWTCLESLKEVGLSYTAVAPKISTLLHYYIEFASDSSLRSGIIPSVDIKGGVTVAFSGLFHLLWPVVYAMFHYL